MFRFLRRRAPGSSRPEPGDVAVEAAARASEFWRHWADELQPEVTAALADGARQGAEHLLGQVVAALHPDPHFSVERGETAIYALVLTGQADPDLRVYTDALMAAAPKADAVWEYHDAVPPVPDPTQVTLRLCGASLSLADTRVAPQVNAADGLVDVVMYHPGLGGLDQAGKEALTFLPLDAALGERLAADRIGRVEIAEFEPRDAIGLLEFRDLVRALDTRVPSDSAHNT